MKRKLLAWLLAPTPVVLSILTLSVMAIMSPAEVINGEVDNDPFRAAMILPFLIPFLFYPGSLAIFAIHIFVADKITGTNVKRFLISICSVSLCLSMMLALGLYQPQFGESYLLTALACFFVVSVMLTLMTLVWKLVRGTVK